MSAGEPLVNDFGVVLPALDFPRLVTWPDNVEWVAMCPICDAPLSGHRREPLTSTQKAGWEFAQRASDKQHPFRAMWRRFTAWLGRP